MEFKNRVFLEVLKEDRIYRLDMPFDAAIVEVYDICLMYADQILKMLIQQNEKMKQCQKCEPELEKQAGE